MICITMALFVDLRLLQPSAEITINDLYPGVEFQGAASSACFGMPGAGVFPTAEWKLNFRTDGRGIDIDYAGQQVTFRSSGGVDIPAVDGRRKTVWDFVHHLNCLFQAAAFQHADDRAEYFLPGYAHSRFHAGENCRLDKKAMSKLSIADPVAASHKLCTLLYSDCDIAADLVGLLLIDNRADIGIFV